MTDLRARPWVLVVGMHRSGTSAIAGALTASGLQSVRPDDRMHWPESNPEHWESLSLGLHNEGLLTEDGGSWDAPPEVDDTSAPPDLSASSAVLAAAYPGDAPAVWKDPRLCLLLPHWRKVMVGPVAAVLVWRSPWAVAESLRKRDDMDPLLGVALWERYNRAALAGLAGVATFVVDYEQVVEQPRPSLDRILTWLTPHLQSDGSAAALDIDMAVASIASGLRHQTGNRLSGGGPLLPSQQHLVDLLGELDGDHDPLHDVVGFDESPWTDEVLRLRRDTVTRQRVFDAEYDRMQSARDQLQAELDSTRRNLEDAHNRIEDANRWIEAERQRADDLSDALATSNRQLQEVYASSSWKMTKPVRASIASIHGLRSRGDGR